MSGPRKTRRARKRARSPRWRPRHVAVLMAASLSAALALALLVVGVDRWREPAAARSPSARPAPSVPPELRARSVSVEEHRQLALQLDSAAPPGTRLEVRDGATLLATAPAGETTGPFTFTALPPRVDLSVHAVIPGASRPVTVTSVRTPDTVPLRSVTCSPGSTSVLVAFEPAAASDFAVEIGLYRERQPRVRVPHSGRTFRQLITGLIPDTDHYLTIRPRGAWGGLSRGRFRTRPAGQRSRLRALLEGGAGPPLLLLLRGDGQLWREPDPDALPLILERVRRDPEMVRLPVGQLLGMAQTYRSRDLLDTLFPRVEGSSDPDEVTALIETCLILHHPAAADLADRHFARARSGTHLDACAEGLASGGGAVACDRLAERVLQLPALPTVRYLGAMIAADRARARERFTGWLAAARTLEPGIAGLALLGEDADVGALIAIARRPAGAPGRELALHALSGSPLRSAREALLAALRADATEDALIWANVRQGDPACVPIFEGALARARVPRVCAALALALGSMRAASAVPRLRDLLEDREESVRDAACWALGRLEDAASAPRLTRLVAEARDRAGMAAYALRQLRHRPAAEALAQQLARLRSAMAPEDAATACLTALALESLGDPRYRDALRGLQSDRGTSAPIQEMARHLTGTAPPEPGAVEWLVFPHVPYVRTGVRLVTGDWVDFTAHGLWTMAGKPLMPVASRTQRELPVDLRLVAYLGRERLVVPRCDEPYRVIASHDGELVLAPVATGVAAAGDPAGRPIGFGRLVLSH